MELQVKQVSFSRILNWDVNLQVEDVEVWHDLAQVYTQVQQWEDAETCLEKARSLNEYSAVTWFNTGNHPLVHFEFIQVLVLKLVVLSKDIIFDILYELLEAMHEENTNETWYVHSLEFIFR